MRPIGKAKHIQPILYILIGLPLFICAGCPTTNDIITSISSSVDNNTTTISDQTPQISYEAVKYPKQYKNCFELYNCGYYHLYDTSTWNPVFVAWELTKEEVNQRIVERTNNFAPNTQLPNDCRVQTWDYTGSGYDRGHMCPSADMLWSEDAQNDCFLMTNMCMQHKRLNSGQWNDLEQKCRSWAQRYQNIYIVCGPIYYDNQKLQRYNEIAIPHAFFKVILILEQGNEKAIGFLFPNQASSINYKDFACSVDEIEKITGLDFFHRVEDKLEKRIEAQYNLSDWF